MKKEILIELINKNLTAKQMGLELNVHEETVRTWLKKYGLKTHLAWTHDVNATHKVCSECGKEKSISKFPLAGCKEDNRKYRRKKCDKCYRKTKGKHRIKVRLWFKEYKKTLKCENCNNCDYRVLDFHHKDDNKEGNISKIVSGAFWSKERIIKEIEKCTVLCANCHRIVHYKEN